MGLFSKKTLVCERCGKEYQSMLAVGHYCPECKKILDDKKKAIAGYSDYAWRIKPVPLGPYDTEEQMDAIIAHRDAILEKYRLTDFMTRKDIRELAINCNSYSRADMDTKIGQMSAVTIEQTAGAGRTDTLIIPTGFTGVVVDVDDVFAVAYRSVYSTQVENDGGAPREAILCAVFTNDPYVPVVPVVYLGRIGFLSYKSKKARAAIEADFTSACSNLRYPVQELKALKKQIKQENTVHGNIDVKTMLNYINDASVDSGMFDARKMENKLNSESQKLLESYGYITDSEIESLLGTKGDPFKKRAWDKRYSHYYEDMGRLDLYEE